MEQDSINQRLNSVVDTFERGVKAAFARKAGISPQGAQELLAGRKGDPSFKVLVKILESYPAIDANWLVLGRGPMLRESSSNSELGPESTPHQNQAPPTEQVEQLVDMIRREVAEQMTASKPLAEVHKLLNDELAQKRIEYIASLQSDVEVIKQKIQALGDAQKTESLELAHRAETIEQAIRLMQNIKPGPDGLAPGIAYRVDAEPDHSKPFDGLLANRLGISEEEARRLVTESEIGSTQMDGYGYEVSEFMVRQYLRPLSRTKKQA